MSSLEDGCEVANHIERKTYLLEFKGFEMNNSGNGMGGDIEFLSQSANAEGFITDTTELTDLINLLRG